MKLRKDAEKNPVYHILIIWFLSLGCSALPLKSFYALFIEDAVLTVYLSQMTFRFLFGAVALIFVFIYGFSGLFKSYFKWGALLILPAFAVSVNNFPFIGFFTGNAYFIRGAGDYLPFFIINCLSIGFFEETVFRGLIFPLIFIKLKDKKRAAFKAAALSSLIFAASHFVNLLSGASLFSTLLQVGYSFLIGGMCAVSVMMTGNLLFAVFLHAVYDIGGLILASEYAIAGGSQWDAATIAITAVIGVAAAVYFIIYALKCDGKNLSRVLEIKEE